MGSGGGGARMWGVKVVELGCGNVGSEGGGAGSGNVGSEGGGAGSGNVGSEGGGDGMWGICAILKLATIGFSLCFS